MASDAKFPAINLGPFYKSHRAAPNHNRNLALQVAPGRPCREAFGLWLDLVESSVKLVLKRRAASNQAKLIEIHSVRHRERRVRHGAARLIKRAFVERMGDDILYI